MISGSTKSQSCHHDPHRTPYTTVTFNNFILIDPGHLQIIIKPDLQLSGSLQEGQNASVLEEPFCSFQFVATIAFASFYGLCCEREPAYSSGYNPSDVVTFIYLLISLYLEPLTLQYFVYICAFVPGNWEPLAELNF